MAARRSASDWESLRRTVGQDRPLRSLSDSSHWSLLILHRADSLFGMLVIRTSFRIGETLSSMILWDVVVAVFAVGLSVWTIWSLQLEADLSDDQPTVSTVLVGD